MARAQAQPLEDEKRPVQAVKIQLGAFFSSSFTGGSTKLLETRRAAPNYNTESVAFHT